MARARITADEAAAVGGDEMRLLDRNGRPFRIGDLRAHGKSSLLATPRHADGFIDIDPPGMVQVEIERTVFMRCQQARFGQPGARVFRGKTGDVERGADGLAQRSRREIRGAGVTLAQAKIDGHADALVAVIFEILDFAVANRDRLPEPFGHIDFAVAGAQFPGMLEHIVGQCLQNGR